MFISSFIHSIYELETTQMSVNRGTDKHSVVYSGILLSIKRNDYFKYATTWVNCKKKKSMLT